MLETYSLRGKDRLLLVAAAILACLPPLLVDHEPGLREAAHAQSLREMMSSGNWFVLTIGGLPWLELPPLTQWFAYVSAKVFGVSNVLTAVRLAGMLPLILATLWTASFAASCSGRRSGMLAGFALLTTLGVAENVWHGGNIIWLVAAGSGFMKLLACLESRLQGQSLSPDRSGDSSGRQRVRIAHVMTVFTLLGLATLIAGPLAAFATILIPSAGHVLFRRSLSLKLNNPWIAGWILTGLIAIVWPVWASSVTGNSPRVWFSFLRSPADFQHSLEQLWRLVQISLPWLPLAVFGQWSIRHDAFAGGYSRERLLALWSISVPVAVFLLMPSNMNLALAAAGAWSISAAIGAEKLTVRVFKELPMLETRHNRAILQKFLAGSAAVLTLSTVWSDLGGRADQVDRALLTEARAVAEEGQAVLVDMKLGNQAAAILLELDDLATPMHSQRMPESWENTVLISSESFQKQAIEQGVVSLISDAGAHQELILVRMARPMTPATAQIASESFSERH